MLTLDATRPAQPPTADPPDADDTYESDLITLLGRLEHRRELLVTARAADRPARALDLAEELMADVAEFSARIAPIGGRRELVEATARGKEFATALGQARAREPADAARRCYHALYEAVLAYFVVFTNRFPTSKAARGWVEVAAAFVVDLKKLAQDPVPA
jgi:hypothetical protein